MKTTYHLEQLKEIIDCICTITNISMCVADIKYNTIYVCEKGIPSYCHKIQKNDIGRAKCYHSDIEMYKKCAVTRRAVSCVCHAGVLDTAVPILKNDVIVGFVMIGRIRFKKDASHIDGLLDWVDDVADIKKHYKQLTYLSEDQISSLIHLLSYVLLENAIEVDFGDLINRATDYIEKNLSEELSLEKLCTQLFVSKNALYKAFRDSYGCTVNKYITAKRIETAKELLCNKNQSVTLTAEMVGFDNYSYFSKLFKKHTGFSPCRYRKHIK